jgi:antitoxin component of MazEF toxin-antitoxin module
MAIAMTTSTTKLTRIGNSTGLTLSREVLTGAGLARGDDVSVSVEGNRVVITKADSDRAEALRVGRRFMARYARTLEALAK